MPHFTDKKLKPRGEKCYFHGMEQKVAIVQVGTGPQNLLDVFTPLVLPAGILEGYALGGISVFVFESWCGFHRHRQEAGHPRQSEG